MDVLYFFVPLSMLVLAVLVWAAFWAIRNNQYDDLEGPAHRILMDDDDPKIPTTQRAENPDAQADKSDGEAASEQRQK